MYLVIDMSHTGEVFFQGKSGMESILLGWDVSPHINNLLGSVYMEMGWNGWTGWLVLLG